MTTAATTSEAAARRAVFGYASTGAEAWTEELERFGALWRSFNDAYFDGALDEPHINIGSPSSPKAFGQFHEVGGDGLRSRITIRTSHVNGTFNRGSVPAPGKTIRYMLEGHDPYYRWRHLAHILLHEMVHQWQYQFGKPSRTQHDVEFTAKCNEIGDRLGFRHVVSRRRKGDPAELPIAAQWPLYVVPEGYYGDLWGILSVPDQVEDWRSQILALWEVGQPPDQLWFLQRIGVSIINDVAEPVVAANGGAEPLSLPERIRAEREQREWSQRELAIRADTHQTVVSKIENGRAAPAAAMARILTVLGLGPEA
jgi:hypothetical protein